MTTEISIVKRNGRKENLDLEKLHKVVFYACDGLTGVSASQVELNSHISFQDNISSKDILSILSLSSERTAQSPVFQ